MGFGTVLLDKLMPRHHIVTKSSAKNESTFISTILPGHYFLTVLSFATVDLTVFIDRPL